MVLMFSITYNFLTSLIRDYFSSSHASVRGFMTAYAEVFAVFGIFLAYLLGSLLPWRLAAITCLIFPLATLVVAISVITIISVFIIETELQFF